MMMEGADGRSKEGEWVTFHISRGKNKRLIKFRIQITMQTLYLCSSPCMWNG